MSSEAGWAQLVSTTDNISEPAVINKNKFLLGRARTADLAFEGNKLVSGCHCIIEKDAEGKVWLQDTSTNGTLVNLSKKVHKMKLELHHGDEIHLVYRKADPTLNIAYVYQDLGTLAAAELDTTVELSSEPDTSAEELMPLKMLVRRKTFEEEPSDDEPETKRAKMVNISSGGFVPKAGTTSRLSPISDETQPPPGVSDETQAPPGISDETQAPPIIDAPPTTSNARTTRGKRGRRTPTPKPPTPGADDETQALPGVDDETQAPPGVMDETQAPPGVEDETQAPPGISDETQAPPIDIAPPTTNNARGTRGRRGRRTPTPKPPTPGADDETQVLPSISDETQAPPGVDDETQAPPGIIDETQALPVSDETQGPPMIDATPTTSNTRSTRGKRGRPTPTPEPAASPSPTPKAKLRRVTPTPESAESSVSGTIDVKDTAVGESKTEEKKDSASAKTDDVPECDPYEETLICIICQEIMHNVISVQPCMHSFCAGCYSGWMKRSNECPSCRGKVKRIHKNHLVNNLVDVYLKQHPLKKRSDSDLKELEERTTITGDMKFPKDRGSFDPDEAGESGPFDDDDDDDDEDDLDGDYDSTDEDDDDDDGGVVLNPNGGGGCAARFNQGINFGGFGHIRPPPTVCRQCPNYVGTANSPFMGAVNAIGNVVNNLVGRMTGRTAVAADPTAAAAAVPGTAAGATATDAAPGPSAATPRPSLPDQKTMPTPPPYACQVGQVHIMCSCCLQPMPDRRNEYILRPDQARPQQCRLCFRMFCHAYWGCNNVNCLGCIGKFQEMNFGRQCLPHLILENQHESALFQRYLDERKITVRDLLEICCDKLRNGTYRTPVLQNPDFVVCYTCGLQQFRDLAYQYRKDIPPKEMPVGAHGRPDCYWGKNCRTQKGKLNHAMRYNHICEQTRVT